MFTTYFWCVKCDGEKTVFDIGFYEKEQSSGPMISFPDCEHEWTQVSKAALKTLKKEASNRNVEEAIKELTEDGD